ncbi:hypothetical protein [Candidatus Binatus sp.]|uniref:hypothetical protein n=1 Tax=Candidatus Binatus sp. TaxID=2811406 RepID=UPI002FDA3B8E
MRETFNEMLGRHRRERESLEAEERAAAREAMVREREANAGAELLRNQQAVQDRVNAAAANPAAMLNEIAKSGVSLEVDDNGVIVATPPGGLGLIYRRAIEQVRPTVITLLRQRHNGEIL